ncbi:hypothetical protein [Vulcanisaeta distributa]|uniref:hypothetical protein n=1 Tax=Vulcanisaeta distributa TaxID=164451 RepID=UPI000A76B778|nr:hypothetical protein [Vulcanisaeta distributa]
MNQASEAFGKPRLAVNDEGYLVDLTTGFVSVSTHQSRVRNYSQPGRGGPVIH